MRLLPCTQHESNINDQVNYTIQRPMIDYQNFFFKTEIHLNSICATELRNVSYT